MSKEIPVPVSVRVHPERVHAGLASLAWGHARARVPEDHLEQLKEAAWNAYRQLTRYAAGCNRTDFYAWCEQNRAGGGPNAGIDPS